MYNPRNFSQQFFPFASRYAEEANHASTLHQLQVGRSRLISLLNPVHLRAVFVTGCGATFTR
jgi:hypothetical protein